VAAEDEIVEAKDKIRILAKELLKEGRPVSQIVSLTGLEKKRWRG